MTPSAEPKRVTVTVRAACQSCPWTHDMPVGTIDAEPATIAISLDVYTGRVAQTHVKDRGHHNFDFLASWEEYIEAEAEESPVCSVCGAPATHRDFPGTERMTQVGDARWFVPTYYCADHYRLVVGRTGGPL